MPTSDIHHVHRPPVIDAITDDDLIWLLNPATLPPLPEFQYQRPAN